MNLRLKRQMEDIINQGIEKTKYQKIYFGKYEAVRDQTVYDESDIITFCNYGIPSKYCKTHNMLIHFKTASHSVDYERCKIIKVRVLRPEMKIISDNNNKIPTELIKKILTREV